MKKYTAFATIKNDIRSFPEEFDVSSEASAEQEIRQVITNFNNTLKPGESPREFVELLEVKVEELPDPIDDEEDDDFELESFPDDPFLDDWDDEEDNWGEDRY